MSSSKTRKRIRRLEGILFLLLLGVCLQHVPGTYTIDDFQDDYELTSPEGVALMALSDASLTAELYFKESTRHRISRNAEIVVPAGATLNVSASMVPFILDEEAVLRPESLLIRSDKALTFIYRFVTVATAKKLTIDPNDPDAQVKATGQYKVLTALATAYRYKRQKAVKRDYKIPSYAKLNFQAHVLPDYKITTAEGYTLFTGPQPGKLSVENAVWDQNRWQEGLLGLSLNFSDLDPLASQAVRDLIPKDIGIGNILTVNILQIFNIHFSRNILSLYVKGTLAYANSDRVSSLFNPSFQTHLEIAFTFPEKTLLSEAEAGIKLKNIHSLDFNRSNPLFDKLFRDVLRSYREDAAETWELSAEFPVLKKLPGSFFIENFEVKGDENGYPGLEMLIRILPVGNFKIFSEKPAG